MTDQDRERFAELMAGLCEYYDRKMSQAIMDLYWSALRSYDADEIQTAAAAHIQDPDRGRFMPKIADFIMAIAGSADEAAAIAWDAVLHRRDLDEFATAALASMGGWTKAIGHQQEDQLPFIARDFQLRYKAYRRRGPPDAQPLLKLVEKPRRPMWYDDPEERAAIQAEGKPL